MAENLNDKINPALQIALPVELGLHRESLQRFFDAMIYKLRRNAKKADPTKAGGWGQEDPAILYDLLMGECEELASAIKGGSTTEIVFEAADVANFALILAEGALMRRRNYDRD